jgi:hypothetical protein
VILEETACPVRSFLPHRSTAFASQYSHSGERAPRPYLWVGRRQAAHGPIWSPGQIRAEASG